MVSQSGTSLKAFVDVRRVLLRKTRYHLYYRVRGEMLEVLAVWHVARDGGLGV